MEHHEASFAAGHSDLTDDSFSGELNASSPPAQLDTSPTNDDPNSHNKQSHSIPSTILAITTEPALLAEATQLRLRIFNSTTLCTSAASAVINSPSPSFPITLEYAKMVLGHPFKASRCHTIQALKFSARVKCTQYNAAAIMDETLVHDGSNFTVEDFTKALSVHCEAQRQQLLDLFGSVEQPDSGADEATRRRSPAIDPPFGVFIGINIRIGREFYANAGVRIHDHAPVAIGRHVRLGPNVSLLTEGHDTDAEARRKGDVFAAPIEIGDDVWIGAGVTVLGGVKIGDGAVVGAGSLVCKDVREGEVVVGVPARVVKRVRERVDEGEW